MSTVNIPREIAQKVLDACPLYATRDREGDLVRLTVTGEQYQHLRELVDACHRAVHGELPVEAKDRARP